MFIGTLAYNIIWYVFYMLIGIFIMLVLDAFDCYHRNEDEDFNTTTGFEYIYEYVKDKKK